MKLPVPPAAGPVTIRSKMNRLVLAVCIPLVIILVVMLALMVVHTQLYTDLLHNVTTASEFNQDFKSNIDLKMYYYVTGSQYSEGLPIEEVQAAQSLARDLLDTTTNRESRLAIASVLDLCQNLEEKIYQIQDTQDYDERQNQLENNINVLTALIQEFMYDYLYTESVQLDTLQAQMNQRLLTELVLVFDGFRTPGNPGSRSDYHNIHVAFTKDGETGDAYIEKIADDIGKNYSVRVVTSDNLIRLSALHSGVLRCSAGEFINELDWVLGQMEQVLRKTNEDAHKTKLKDGKQ